MAIFPAPPHILVDLIAKEQPMKCIDEVLAPHIKVIADRAGAKMLLIGIWTLLPRIKKAPEPFDNLNLLMKYTELLRHLVLYISRASTKDAKAQNLLGKFERLADGYRRLHRLIMPWEHAGCEYNTEDKLEDKNAEIDAVMEILGELGVGETFERHVDSELWREWRRQKAVVRMGRKSVR
jgi:hypothetical protein